MRGLADLLVVIAGLRLGVGVALSRPAAIAVTTRFRS